MSSTDTSSANVLHPASGVLILGLDWLLFSGTVLSLGLSTPMLAALGFALGTGGTALLQRWYGGDSGLKSILKGLLGGVAVGIPMPIAGTAVGGAILTLSGLNRLMDRTRREDRSLPEEDASS